jgi:hypothetical protein
MGFDFESVEVDKVVSILNQLFLKVDKVVSILNQLFLKVDF